MAQEVKGIVVAKASTGKSIKIGEDWYSAFKASELNSIEKGDEVIVMFNKKGTFKNISSVKKVEKEVKEDAEFKCEVCGKTLKDGKYKKCYECNQKKEEVKKEPELQEEKPKSSYTNSSSGDTVKYGSPEDINGKQVGCAVAAAASAAAGQTFADAETAAEWIKIVATSLLNWMRINQ